MLLLRPLVVFSGARRDRGAKSLTSRHEVIQRDPESEMELSLFAQLGRMSRAR